jgi:hypothetical protein
MGNRPTHNGRRQGKPRVLCLTEKDYASIYQAISQSLLPTKHPISLVGHFVVDDSAVGWSVLPITAGTEPWDSNTIRRR